MNERNPKKSKALLITFIIVLALLVAGYLLLKKTNIFSTEGLIGKNFAPLLGTSKEKPLTTIGGTATSTATKTNTAGTTKKYDSKGRLIDENGNLIDANGHLIDANGNLIDAKGNIVDANGNILKMNTGTGYTPYIPPLNPLPLPNSYNNNTYTMPNNGGYIPPAPGVTVRQCNDGIDNDKDGLIDSADPGCHTDFDAKNYSSYDPTINDESRDGTVGKKTPVTPFQCPDDDVKNYLTDAEKAQLADLTRQYYEIAATLASPDDVSAEYAMGQSYEDLASRANELSTQTIDWQNGYDDVNARAVTYTGPTRKRDNPYNPDGNYPSGNMSYVTAIPFDYTAVPANSDTQNPPPKKNNYFNYINADPFVPAPLDHPDDYLFEVYPSIKLPLPNPPARPSGPLGSFGDWLGWRDQNLLPDMVPGNPNSKGDYLLEAWNNHRGDVKTIIGTNSSWWREYLDTWSSPYDWHIYLNYLDSMNYLNFENNYNIW